MGFLFVLSFSFTCSFKLSPPVESSVSSLPFIPLLGRNLSFCQEGLKLSGKVLKGILCSLPACNLHTISLGNRGGTC